MIFPFSKFKYCAKIQQKNDISKFLRLKMSLKLQKVLFISPLFL